MKPTRPGRSSPMMMAVVLGTALSAAGASAAVPEKTVTDLSRYCSACWRNARLPIHEWPDCTQEVFVRLLERIPANGWAAALKTDGDEKLELHRAIDAVRKRVQRRKVAAPVAVEDLPARATDAPAVDIEQLETAAAEVLSDRQRRILEWSAEGWPVADMARELAIDPARVSDEKYKAIRKLRQRLANASDRSTLI